MKDTIEESPMMQIARSNKNHIEKLESDLGEFMAWKQDKHVI